MLLLICYHSPIANVNELCAYSRCLRKAIYRYIRAIFIPYSHYTHGTHLIHRTHLSNPAGMTTLQLARTECATQQHTHMNFKAARWACIWSRQYAPPISILNLWWQWVCNKKENMSKCSLQSSELCALISRECVVCVWGNPTKWHATNNVRWRTFKCVCTNSNYTYITYISCVYLWTKR